MKKKTLYTVFTAIIFCFLGSGVFAEMQSNNFSIPTSVFPGGGVSMSSANYQSDSTLAQPSPLSEPSDLPESANYDLYSGFWYTMDFFKAKNKAMPWIPLLLFGE